MSDKSRTVYCDECLQGIRVRNDLIVTSIALEFVPFHNACYAKSLKTTKTLFLNNNPMNGSVATFLSIVCILFAIVFMFVIPEGIYFSFILLIQPVIRIYVWVLYERYLD